MALRSTLIFLSFPLKNEIKKELNQELTCCVQGGCSRVTTLNDSTDYKAVRKALNIIEFSSEEQDALFAIVGSVLQLGNVGFKRDGEGICLENARPVNFVSKVNTTFYINADRIVCVLKNPCFIRV